MALPGILDKSVEVSVAVLNRSPEDNNVNERQPEPLSFPMAVFGGSLKSFLLTLVLKNRDVLPNRP